jgi:hypothetical protein
MESKLACISHNREGYWCEAIAVGAPYWLRQAADEAGIKRYVVKIGNEDDENSYINFMIGKN